MGQQAVWTALTMIILAALALSGPADADTMPRAVLVVPFDASSLAPDEQWMGEGVAQLISLGLKWHPAFVQIERSRLGRMQGPAVWSDALVSQVAHELRVDAVLYGRIGRKNADLVLQPMVLNLTNKQAVTISFPPIAMSDADFLARSARLPASYARALRVALTDDQNARVEKAARPTASLQALELLTRGQMAFYRGANEDAIDLMWRATLADPNFVMAQYALGAVHEAIGNRWKAAAQYRAATLLDSTMPEPLKALGDLFLGAPRPLVSQAIEAYSRAISLRPFYAEAYVGLGDARAANGDIKYAIAAYQKALSFDPFHSRPHLRLGKIYADTGHCGDSLNAYRGALELDPDSAEARSAVEAISAGGCRPVGP